MVLTQNGVSEELYGLYIRKATQIDRLESRERVVSGQKYKISNENLTLVKINERLRQENYDFFFQAEDGIRDGRVTGVQTCALPIFRRGYSSPSSLNPGSPR